MTTATHTVNGGLLVAKRGHVDVIDIPEYCFAQYEGKGSPESPLFGRAVQALYSIAYGVRFGLRGQGIDERVAPLEALWTFPGATDFAVAGTVPLHVAHGPDRWGWRVMIRLPDAADRELIENVRGRTCLRRPELLETLQSVTVDVWTEGLAVQTLHVGPYSAELPTVELLRDYIRHHGYRAVGLHHEIYLSDPRRCAPARLRTILRQPIAVE